MQYNLSSQVSGHGVKTLRERCLLHSPELRHREAAAGHLDSEVEGKHGDIPGGDTVDNSKRGIYHPLFQVIHGNVTLDEFVSSLMSANESYQSQLSLEK